MPRGFGGFMRGAAAVAVPMLLEQEKEKQIAARDQRLADLQAARDKQLKIDRAEEAREQRKFERSENRKTREHSESLSMAQIAAQQADSARRQELGERQLEQGGERLGLEQEQDKRLAEQHGKNMELVDLQLEVARDAGADTKELRRLRTEAIAASKSGDTDTVADYLNQISILSGEKKKFSATRESILDEDGEAIPGAYRTIIIDTSTGEARLPLLQSNTGSQYRTKEEIGEAYKAGKLTRAQAEEMLRHMKAFE